MSQSLFTDLEQAPADTSVVLQQVLDAMPWDQHGLIPAIAQDATSDQVLMLAWMNREALSQTLTSGEVHYFSRSRQALWRKGETSGHTQNLIEARLDCDGDALLLRVEQQGPACHTNRTHCFYNQLSEQGIKVVFTKQDQANLNKV